MLQNTPFKPKVINVNLENTMLIMDVKYANQTKVFILQHMIQLNVLYLIRKNFSRQLLIKLSYQKAIGDQIIYQTYLLYVLKQQDFVQEDGMLEMHFVAKAMLVLYVKNVTFIMLQEMENSQKINKIQNVFFVLEFYNQDLIEKLKQTRFIRNLNKNYKFYCSIIPFILNTAWAILSIILTLKSIGKSNDLFLFYKIQGSFNQILFKLNQDLEGILIKMLLNYLWIFSVIFTLNTNFSFQFNFVEQASNQSYSMANNLDCYLSETIEVELIYSKIILILILLLMQFMIIIFGLIMYSILINSSFKLNNISNTLLCLYIFNYAGFIKMLCSVLSYREISNIQYISGNLTLKFNTETHLSWIVNLVIPALIIFGCLIPLSLFVLMYFHRKGLDNYIFRPHICYLYNEYEKKSYYWEQIKLSKRAIMILILTYFETNIHLKVSLIGLSLIIYQLLAINKKPYIITKFNKFDLQAGQLCSVSIFLSAIKYESEKLNNNLISLALQICLMVLFILITFPFIQSIGMIYSQHNRQKYYMLFIFFDLQILSEFYSQNCQSLQYNQISKYFFPQCLEFIFLWINNLIQLINQLSSLVNFYNIFIFLIISENFIFSIYTIQHIHESFFVWQSIFSYL